MKYLNFLNQIQRRLRLINCFEHNYEITEFLCPTKSQNALVVKESGEDAEVLVCIDESILLRNQNLSLPHDFHLKSLPDLFVVIEELSHFNTFCSNALVNRSLSQLELEIQGEVDKFAVVLDWLYERNEANLRDQVYDLMFGVLQLGQWVSSKDKPRYQEAHEISKNFIRKVLLRSKSAEEARASFREFFSMTTSQKCSLKF